jgi:hypothetical protein
VGLISDYKSTQEKLKKDKGICENEFSKNPYSYQNCVKNWIRTLWVRKNHYFSKITWEFYMYSKGETEQLKDYWKAQDERGETGHKVYSLE